MSLRMKHSGREIASSAPPPRNDTNNTYKGPHGLTGRRAVQPRLTPHAFYLRGLKESLNSTAITRNNWRITAEIALLRLRSARNDSPGNATLAMTCIMPGKMTTLLPLIIITGLTPIKRI